MKLEHKIFNHHRRKWFDTPLKAHGFVRYKTSHLARVTEGGVLQLLNFQKSAYGSPQFCLNIVSRPLFWHNKFLALTPGFRITHHEDWMDRWHSYTDEETAVKGFDEAWQNFQKFGMPFFENTLDAGLMIKAYEQRKFKPYIWGNSPWLEFDLAHLHLKTGDFSTAFTYLEKASDQFEKDPYLQEYHTVCEYIIRSLSNQEAIGALLLRNFQESAEFLKLADLIPDIFPSF